MPASRMDHRRHQPGTVADCDECSELAYEPGWYRIMLGRPFPGEDLEELLVVLPEIRAAPADRPR